VQFRDRITDAIAHVDTNAMQLTAGTGATIAAWQAAARQVGLDTPIDFAARDSATVGGAIATNAGGSRVLRYGTMRRQVVGIEAVLANGSVVGTLTGLAKETVGLHWPSVLAGSEGTLAVVTAARLRLVPRFEYVVTAMLSTATVDDAVGLVGHLRHRLGSLDSIEIIQPEALDLVAGHLGATPPVDVVTKGTVLLVECADHSDPSAALATALTDALGVVDSAVAVDPTQRHHLVQFRDRITDAIAAAASTLGVPTYKLDVAVPLGAVAELLAIAHRAAADDAARLIPFGHLAEGNLHLNFLGATAPAAIAESVLTAVARLGGTISAEHGIGVAKTQWLHLVRSRADLDAQGALRRALDPNRILNPGVLESSAPARQVP
jgi:FAD/FMN-containing dehydrogenase